MDVLLEGIERYAVDQVVVASTCGDTGLAAARILRDSKVKLVVGTGHRFRLNLYCRFESRS